MFLFVHIEILKRASLWLSYLFVCFSLTFT